jgi:hypothetical protein
MVMGMGDNAKAFGLNPEIVYCIEILPPVAGNP